MEKNWFEIVKLKDSAFAICEPHHFQEIISYLIIGSKRAVLFDTGMGIENIRDVVSGLTDKEVIVVNSHCHFDHIGGNCLFGEAHIFNDPAAMRRLTAGYSEKELAPHTKAALFEAPFDERFGGFKYAVRPSVPVPVKDGDVFDLGDRALEVIHTPGHSPDSIMLLDKKQRMLFTGDTYYPGHLYAHFEGDFYGSSDISLYADSLERVFEMRNNFDTIHPGHNKPSGVPDELGRAAKAMRELALGKVRAREPLVDMFLASLSDEGEEPEGYPDSKGLFVYTFGGFKIIAREVSS